MTPENELEALCITPRESVRDAMQRLGQTTKRTLAVVGEDRLLLGVLSDGDIRRFILGRGELDAPIEGMYTRSPFVFTEAPDPEQIALEMARRKITGIPEVDPQGRVVAVHSWDQLATSGEVPARRVDDASVVVMAGGEGRRLDPFTRILPKALVPVGSKSVLEHILYGFARHGVVDVHLVLHHKAELIRAYLDSLAEHPSELSFVVEPRPLGTAGGLSLLDPGSLAGDVFLTNCDILVETDLAELLDFHRERGHLLTVVGASRELRIPYGVLDIGEDGRLERMNEKPSLDYVVNTGLYVLRREVLARVPDEEETDLTDLIQILLDAGEPVGVFPVSSRDWLDVGQWPEYRRSRSLLGGEDDPSA